MFTNKSLIISVSVAIGCVILGLVCAFLLNFDLVSIFMLAGIVTLAIIINVFCWKTIVKNNKNK